MKENIVKIVIATAVTGISAYFGAVVIPLTVLVLVMAGDYATGVAAAFVTKTVSSRTGIVGIVKKVCYLATVAVGVTVDFIVSSTLPGAGIDMPSDFRLFGLAVTVWLIVNELISILENLARIGVPLPEFLKVVLAKLNNSMDDRMNGKK